MCEVGTLIKRGGPDWQVVVQVGDAQRVERGGPRPVQKLAQEEDVLVAGQLRVEAAVAQRSVAARRLADGVVRLTDLVHRGGEVGHGEDEGAHAQHEHAHGHVHRLAAPTA